MVDNMKLRKMAWISLKKWLRNNNYIYFHGCIFCTDANRNMNGCAICLAPKILCAEGVSGTLYGVWRYSDKRVGKGLMRLSLLSLVLFKKVIRPIRWFVLRLISKHEYGV